MKKLVLSFAFLGFLAIPLLVLDGFLVYWMNGSYTSFPLLFIFFILFYVLLFFIFSYRDMEQILESLKQSPYVTAWQLRFSMCMYGGFLLLSIICDNYFYPTTLVFIFALFSVFFLQVNLNTISLLQQEQLTG